MTSTPRPLTPFAARLTPETAAEWEAYQAAGKRAHRAYQFAQGLIAPRPRSSDRTRPHTFHACTVCGQRTRRDARVHTKCEDQP